MERYQRIHLREPEYTACKVCAHGPRDGSDECRHPEVATLPSRGIKAMRAVGGPCGIEADRMDFPGLRLV